MSYDVYRPVHEFFAKAYRTKLGLPKEMKKDPKFVDRLLQDMGASYPQIVSSLMFMVLTDEQSYFGEGSRIYFPESKELLQQLWDAHMELLPGDIQAAGVPSAFTVAWPRDAVIDGIRLPGCLIWWSNGACRNKQRDDMLRKFGADPRSVTICGSHLAPEQRGLFITFLGSKGGSCRSSIPEDKLEVCLRSIEDMTAVGPYKDLGLDPLLEQLGDEEQHQIWVLLRLVTRLLVYITACPQAVVDGWPTGASHKDAGSGFNRVWSPVRIQDVTHGHGHGSPIMHWRRWTFRKYPIRKDGSRQDGLVFVHGTLVGATVDPKTVTTLETHGTEVRRHK